MDQDRKEPVTEEEECKPLTDEEFREFREKDKRTEKKVKRFFTAIWEAINFFT